ncbi:lebercilin-like protein [Trachemys scripta elegans]|uniref:lebercilin-like protein n=1 Tax=Trachemys scripta elegans TaxID=31138 RepID=UPI00155745A9|nr:lebercilin-like protein [Trachemys scripta elegans]
MKTASPARTAERARSWNPFTMSSTSNTMMALDDCFLRIIMPEDSKSESYTRSRGSNESPRTSKSTRSSSSSRINDYSRCSRECESESSHVNYSDDFLTDYSESAGNSNYLELSGTKEKKLQKKKNRKNGQPKGGKKLPPKKMRFQNISFLSTQNNMISQKKDATAQRILSARLHKIKELKNELSDLQHKLEASNLENQLLKQLQYRHLKAIGKYENAENNLPDLIAKHYSEVRSLRGLLRKSQEQERNTSRKLRDVEAELLKTKDALQVLQKLSEDTNLAERGELTHRLSILTEKMEANDKRIQGLEKQLKLNSSIFSRQLAAENRKTVAARTITKNLQMEIKSLQQKIKEKEREVGIKNIYANRMLKSLQDKADPVPRKKGVSLSKSVQVNKQNFKSAQVSHHQNQGTVKSAALCLEGKKTTEDRNRKVEPYEDTKHKIEIEPTTKPSKQETFNRTCREFLSDEIQLTEEKTHFEFMERKKKKREVQERKADLLKEELEKLMKAGQTRPTNDVPIRKNNQEKVVAEENKKEERKSKQPSDKGAADDKSVTPTQNNRTPTRLKKQYTFTEATENLHQGLPASGPVSNTGSLRKNRQTGRHQSETAELKARNSFGIYEPSFGKVTKTRQKDAEDGSYVRTTLIERKNSLMEELFGPSYVLNNHSTPNTKGLDKEQTIVDNERLHNYTSEISNTDSGLQCGDSKLTLGKSKLTTSSSDIK